MAIQDNGTNSSMNPWIPKRCSLPLNFQISHYGHMIRSQRANGPCFFRPNASCSSGQNIVNALGWLVRGIAESLI
jgi:hypothetical protein